MGVLTDHNAMISGLASLQLLAEATVGYHRKLIDGGVPAEIAGPMTKDFHDTLLKAAEHSLNKDKKNE